MRWRADEMEEWANIQRVAARAGVAPSWSDAAIAVVAAKIRRRIRRGVPPESFDDDTLTRMFRRLIEREPHVGYEAGSSGGRPRKEAEEESHG
jgi:hypothetical protein